LQVWREGTRLKAEFELSDDPAAERVRKQIGQTLFSTSVGFVPINWSFTKDPGRDYGIDFTEAELLEFSIVTLPANVDATIDLSTTKSAEAQERAAIVAALKA